MLDAKTLRAVVLADLLAFLSIAGIAWFLGFDVVPSLIAGAVAGALSAAIVLGAALRSHRLGTDRPRDGRPPTTPEPRFPGAPEAEVSGTAAGEPTDTTDTDEDHRG